MKDHRWIVYGRAGPGCEPRRQFAITRENFRAEVDAFAYLIEQVVKHKHVSAVVVEQYQEIVYSKKHLRDMERTHRRVIFRTKDTAKSWWE